MTSATTDAVLAAFAERALEADVPRQLEEALADLVRAEERLDLVREHLAGRPAWALEADSFLRHATEQQAELARRLGLLLTEWTLSGGVVRLTARGRGDRPPALEIVAPPAPVAPAEPIAPPPEPVVTNDSAPIADAKEAAADDDPDVFAGDEADEADGAPDARIRPDWPRWNLVRGRRAVFVGTDLREPIREALEEAFALADLECLPGDGGRKHDALVEHIASGKVDLLFLLRHAVAPRSSDKLIEACRKRRAPFAFVASADVTAMRAGLDEYSERIGARGAGSR